MATTAITTTGDDELRDTILRLAKEGALLATNCSGEGIAFANERTIQRYVADKLKDRFEVQIEFRRGDYEKQFHTPDHVGDFKLDLVLWKDTVPRAIIELKLTADPEVTWKDVARTRRFVRNEKFDPPVLGLVVVCACYANLKQREQEIADARRLAEERNCTPTEPLRFEQPFADAHVYGVAVGLTV